MFIHTLSTRNGDQEIKWHEHDGHPEWQLLLQVSESLTVLLFMAYCGLITLYIWHFDM